MSDLDNECKLLKKVVYSEWQEVRATPFEHSPFSGKHLLLKTEDATVVVFTGKALGLKGNEDIPDGYEETFCLDVLEAASIDPWNAKDRKDSPFRSRNLRKKWQGSSQERLLTPPRSITFYTIPEFDRVVNEPEGLLDRCVAIEISKGEGDNKVRFLVAASQRDPICLRLTWDSEEIAELKDETGMFEVSPDDIRPVFLDL